MVTVPSYAVKPTVKDSAPDAMLLAWYDRHRRHLPWRALPGESSDPYKVWLSEIMLQQTTVKAVEPYFNAFISRWPDVRAMASSDIEDILRAWAGLGYYSRARNLHKCARMIVDNHGGNFPDTVEGLRALPGIGAYTAAAIAAIAFARKAAVVDGNVERVITRLEAVDIPLPQARPVITGFVDRITPESRPGDFAQAMMDLGATLCTPRRPACVLCPLATLCKARQAGEQETYPRKAPRKPRPVRRWACFWITRPDGWVLVRKRPDKGLLGGMTEIPSCEPGEDAAQKKVETLAPLRARWRKLPGEVKHIFTHFELLVTVYAADALLVTRAPEGCRWVALDKLDSEALPSVMRKVTALVGRGSQNQKLNRAG